LGRSSTGIICLFVDCNRLWQIAAVEYCWTAAMWTGMSNWSDDVINALDSTSESKMIGETVGEVHPVQLLQTNFNLQGRPKTVREAWNYQQG
jgi:hypothetical protein